MRISLQPAFVLHRRPYRNTSLLVEVLAQDYGRVGLVARGVRTARSRIKGLLQPFTPLLLSWSGKGELMTLTAAEDAGLPIMLSPTRLFSGFYVNELLLRLLPRHDPHPGLFEAYRRVVTDLAGVAEQEAALRIFEKRLLAELGYGLMLEVEAGNDRPIRSETNYLYVLDRGPVPADGQSGFGIPISGKSLLALSRECFGDADELREAKRLTRSAIGVHLGDQPLRTRQLLLSSPLSREGRRYFK